MEVFQYQHNPTVQQIWATLEQQLAACTECINGLHTAQVGALAQGMQDSATTVCASVDRSQSHMQATAGVVSAHLWPHSLRATEMPWFFAGCLV